MQSYDAMIVDNGIDFWLLVLKAAMVSPNASTETSILFEMPIGSYSASFTSLCSTFNSSSTTEASCNGH